MYLYMLTEGLFSEAVNGWKMVRDVRWMTFGKV